jgi:hypothetical protein
MPISANNRRSEKYARTPLFIRRPSPWLVTQKSVRPAVLDGALNFVWSRHNPAVVTRLLYPLDSEKGDLL